MNSRSRKERKKAAILPFMREAGFFIDRGMRFLHRSDYDRALRSFRRAVELEPSNPENLCHLAGVLAETGQFQDSNEILFRIVNELAPEKTEVWFYLANNFANMEDFHKAEEMALRYLKEAPGAEYQDDAHDLLEYIYFEMGVEPRRYFGAPLESLYMKHDAARKSLEEGKFFEAIAILQEIVEEKPDFIPACNNLALAYYYTGNIEKAMETIERTLEFEPGNLHALCNLAILLAHANRVSELLPLLEQLKAVLPFHQEYTYKLATTMGVLGQHEEAYWLFKRLFRRSFPEEASAFHFAAISAYSTNRTNQALRWWQKAKQLDPQSGIADYYVNMIQEQAEQKEQHPIPYYYHRPMEQVPEEIKWTSVEAVKDDSMIRASLLWALQYGKEEVQEMVIHMLGMIGDEEAYSTLLEFSQSTANRKLRETARRTLKEWTGHRGTTVAESDDPVQAGFVRHFQRTGKQELFDWAVTVWNRYQESTDKPLQLRKPMAWLAAIEYLYSKTKGESLTKADLSRKYDISVATLTKCVNELSALDLNPF